MVISSGSAATMIEGWDIKNLSTLK